MLGIICTSVPPKSASSSDTHVPAIALVLLSNAEVCRIIVAVINEVSMIQRCLRQQ